MLGKFSGEKQRWYWNKGTKLPSLEITLTKYSLSKENYSNISEN